MTLKLFTFYTAYNARSTKSMSVTDTYGNFSGNHGKKFASRYNSNAASDESYIIGLQTSRIILFVNQSCARLRFNYQLTSQPSASFVERNIKHRFFRLKGEYCAKCRGQIFLCTDRANKVNNYFVTCHFY